MTVPTQCLASVLPEIYAGVGRTERWPAIVDKIAEVTGADSGCILAAHTEMPYASVNCFANIEAEWIDAYNRHYWQFDPSPGVMQSRPGEVLVDHVTGPGLRDAGSDSRIFYNEVMRPQRFRHTLAIGLPGPRAWQAGVILQRSGHRGGFADSAARTLAELARHLQQALDLHARLAEAGALGGGMAALLEDAPVGVLLVDGTGTVVRRNRRAEGILQRTQALTITDGLLKARHPRDQEELQVLIDGAAAGRPGRRESVGGTMRTRSADPCSALNVEVRPAAEPRGPDPLGHCQAYAAVCISPVNGVIAPSPGALRELYDLTVAESEVLAGLVAGRSLAEMAAVRGASYETVRSQLKSVMAKLGVSRQAELLRVVLASPATAWSGRVPHSVERPGA